VPTYSEADFRALAIMNSTAKFKEGRFEIGLLWKSENAALPDSYPNALRRLMCLQWKFIKEPALKIQTQKEIDSLVQKEICP